MFTLMYLVVTVGLIGGIVVLGVTVAKGRTAPPRQALWVTALVVLALDTVVHVLASIGMLVAGAGGEGAWFVMGTLGFLAILIAAVLRPRWAGWALLASAAVVPLLLAVGGLVISPGSQDGMPWMVAAVTYSVPAAVSGGLLVLSTKQRRHLVESPPEIDPGRHGDRTDQPLAAHGADH